jgi:hypothetical protein
MLSGDEQSSSLSDSDELLLEGVVERDEIVIGESCWPLIDGLADCGELVVNGALALKKVLFKSSVPLLNADLRIL